MLLDFFERQIAKRMKLNRISTQVFHFALECLFGIAMLFQHGFQSLLILCTVDIFIFLFTIDNCRIRISKTIHVLVILWALLTSKEQA